MKILCAFAFLLGSYLSGSVPYGYLFCRIFFGEDIRKKGSQNIGASNVKRVYGLIPGAIVFLLDLGKAIAPAILAKIWFPDVFWGLTPLASGLFSVIGYCYPPWPGLKFNGGKGMSTASAVILILYPWLALILLPFWFLTKVLTGYISIATMATIGPGFVLSLILMGRWADLIFAVLIALIVIHRHKPNRIALRNGTENIASSLFNKFFPIRLFNIEIREYQTMIFQIRETIFKTMLEDINWKVWQDSKALYLSLDRGTIKWLDVRKIRDRITYEKEKANLDRLLFMLDLSSSKRSRPREIAEMVQRASDKRKSLDIRYHKLTSLESASRLNPRPSLKKNKIHV